LLEGKLGNSATTGREFGLKVQPLCGDSMVMFKASWVKMGKYFFKGFNGISSNQNIGSNAFFFLIQPFRMGI
jgi:hypothetical protein